MSWRSTPRVYVVSTSRISARATRSLGSILLLAVGEDLPTLRGLRPVSRRHDQSGSAAGVAQQFGGRRGIAGNVHAGTEQASGTQVVGDRRLVEPERCLDEIVRGV